jgi:hypothetical protein
MIAAAAALGGAAFVLSSLVVSVRLLLLARRTREIPEFVLGLGLLLMGAVGYPLSTIARLEAFSHLQAPLFAIHSALTLLAQSGIALFNWRVFRPAEGWARALTFGFIGTLAAFFVWQSLGPGWAPFARTDRGPWAAVEVYTLVALGWAGVESLLYHLKLRKRLALGLADPIVADRLRLWAVSMFSAFACAACVSILRIAGVPMTAELTGLLVAPLALTIGCAVWLAFLPPRRYVERVAARAARAA